MNNPRKQRTPHRVRPMLLALLAMSLHAEATPPCVPQHHAAIGTITVDGVQLEPGTPEHDQWVGRALTIAATPLGTPDILVLGGVGYAPVP